MANKADTLSELLRKEVEIYDTLQSVIADTAMEDSDVDALSLRYENCIRAILSFQSKTIIDIQQKCDFIFMIIGRSYNEGELLAAMQESLKKDIEALVTQ
jgi:hypothetical protein